MLESDIQKACIDWLALQPAITAWRQNQIPVPLPNGGFRRFTGKKGQSDIIGWLTQDVVLHDGTTARFSNFLAIEVKQPGGKPTPDQEQFLKDVNAGGGIGICVASVDELADAIGRYL